jgi:hypothetical protein
MESWCLGMLKECLVFSFMRLGVPFIAPRKLGAVESNPGRQILPSIDWCTGQSGAPPDTIQCKFLSCSGAADHWRFRAVGAPDTVRCPLQTVGSPDSLVHHRTVRWFLAVRCWLDSRERRLRRSRLTGQSGAPSDSPVIYIRTPPSRPESRQFTRCQPDAPDTVRCTTGQSGAPRLSRVLAARAKSFPFVFSLILALRQIC